MPNDTPKPAKCPLLETILAQRGLPLKALYTIHDAAGLFDVSVRAIQERVKLGKLNARNLPGRARFLSVDLEEFLVASSRTRS